MLQLLFQFIYLSLPYKLILLSKTSQIASNFKLNSSELLLAIFALSLYFRRYNIVIIFLGEPKSREIFNGTEQTNVCCELHFLVYSVHFSSIARQVHLFYSGSNQHLLVARLLFASGVIAIFEYYSQRQARSFCFKQYRNVLIEENFHFLIISNLLIISSQSFFLFLFLYLSLYLFISFQKYSVCCHSTGNCVVCIDKFKLLLSTR